LPADSKTGESEGQYGADQELFYFDGELLLHFISPGTIFICRGSLDVELKPPRLRHSARARLHASWEKAACHDEHTP